MKNCRKIKIEGNNWENLVENLEAETGIKVSETLNAAGYAYGWKNKTEYEIKVLTFRSGKYEIWKHDIVRI